MALIELKNVSKTYHSGENSVCALQDISLSVNDGEMVAIVGKSGSGKSTLMNLIGTLDFPDSGHYLLDGTEVSSLSSRRLSDVRAKKIGFVFQRFNLIPGLSALENVALPLLYRGIGRKERERAAALALEKVGLSERMQHLPSQLSGGQQQRVAIARAMISDPPILLADEPTGNLDSHSGAEILQILSDLHRNGSTVLIITHDNGIAEQMPRVICMADGRIL